MDQEALLSLLSRAEVKRVTAASLGAETSQEVWPIKVGDFLRALQAARDDLLSMSSISFTLAVKKLLIEKGQPFGVSSSRVFHIFVHRKNKDAPLANLLVTPGSLEPPESCPTFKVKIKEEVVEGSPAKNDQPEQPQPQQKPKRQRKAAVVPEAVITLERDARPEPQPKPKRQRKAVNSPIKAPAAAVAAVRREERPQQQQPMGQAREGLLFQALRQGRLRAESQQGQEDDDDDDEEEDEEEEDEEDTTDLQAVLRKAVRLERQQRGQVAELRGEVERLTKEKEDLRGAMAASFGQVTSLNRDLDRKKAELQDAAAAAAARQSEQVQACLKKVDRAQAELQSVRQSEQALKVQVAALTRDLQVKRAELTQNRAELDRVLQGKQAAEQKASALQKMTAARGLGLL